MLDPGAIVANRYRVQRVLGRGAYGAVYAAARLDSDAFVALKIMHERLGDDEVGAKRFTREAQMVRELRHPNIVQLLDFGSTGDDLPFIAFEMLTGTTLRDHLDTVGPMPMLDCAKLGRQVLSALATAHAQGIVHRDIKPANVFLCDAPPGLVKVLDFGIAKALESQQTKLTGTGQMVGTPRYMPPEQVRGQTVDARSDIYAVGALLAEALTGTPLVKGESQIDIFVSHLSDEPLEIPPRLASSPLGSVVERAVQKSPDARFQSAEAMSVALDAVAPSTAMPPAPTAVLQSASIHPPVVPSAPVAAASSRRNIVLVGAAGALTLAIGIGLGVSLSGGGSQSQRKKRKRKKKDKPELARSKSKKRTKRRPTESPGPAQPTLHNTWEIEPARIRKLLTDDGFTISGGKTMEPSQGLGIATFFLTKDGMNVGHVMMTYVETPQIIETYRRDTVPEHTAQVIRSRTVVQVTLPLGDSDAMARRIMALHPQKK